MAKAIYQTWMYPCATKLISNVMRPEIEGKYFHLSSSAKYSDHVRDLTLIFMCTVLVCKSEYFEG